MLDYEHIDRKDINDVSVKSVEQILTNLHFPRKFIDKLLFNINRDNVRSPMAWSNTRNAGFSAKGKPWLKVNELYKKGINVSDNLSDPNSILNYYKKLIALRNSRDVLQYGEFIPLKYGRNIISFKRVLNEEVYLVYINLSKHRVRNKIIRLKKTLIIANYALTEDTRYFPAYYAAIYKLD